MPDIEYTHYAFSIRMGAWWGKSSIYTSDVKDARPFTEAEVIKHCKTRYGNQGLGDIPVRIADIEAVVQK